MILWFCDSYSHVWIRITLLSQIAHWNVTKKAQSEGTRKNENKLQANFDWTVKKKKKTHLKSGLPLDRDQTDEYNITMVIFKIRVLHRRHPEVSCNIKLLHDSLGIQQVEFLNFWHAHIIIALTVHGSPECLEIQLGVFHTAYAPSDGTPAMLLHKKVPEKKFGQKTCKVTTINCRWENAVCRTSFENEGKQVLRVYLTPETVPRHMLAWHFFYWGSNYTTPHLKHIFIKYNCI